jgi:glycosyltransferase involved in cell wall biosynthesis
MQKRIRVLFIVNSFRYGGAEKHVISLLNHIDTTRFHLTVAYLKDEVEMLKQIDLSRLDGGVISVGVGSRFDIAAVNRLRGVLKENRTEVIICTNAFSLFYGSLANALSGLKTRLVEVFHTTVLRSTKNKLQMLFYRPFFKAADQIVYVCNTQRDYWEARKLGAKKSTVIHNGIDVGFFENKFEKNEILSLRKQFEFNDSDFVIGICAALRPEKAHLDLLEAISRLRRSGSVVKCLIIGDGPERATIEQAITERDLAGSVKITGFVSDVRLYISSCDLMSLVSRHIETFSLSALESMAMGKPVIMSDVGGATEQIVEEVNGLIFPPGDINALEAAIRRMQELISGTPGISDNVRRTVVERFSLQTMVQQFEIAFEELADFSSVQPNRQTGRNQNGYM